MNRSQISSLTLRGTIFGLTLAVAAPAFAGPGSGGAQPSLEELTSVAEDAYIFGYPLLVMDAKRQMMTQSGEAGSSDLFINVFQHRTSLPSPQSREETMPNVDTLASSAWLDLSNEPLVLHVPDTAGRYYALRMIDAWTNVFAAPGKRTTGTGEQDFIIVGPDFAGNVPEGLTRIDAPTNTLWLINRIEVGATNDLSAVQSLQLEFTLTRLSDFESGQAEMASTPGAQAQGSSQTLTPAQQVAELSGAQFFTRLSELLVEAKPKAEDAAALERFQVLGLIAGETFRPSVQVSGVLDTAKQNAQERIKGGAEDLTENNNGWSVVRENIGTYGTNYLARASVAAYNVGASLRRDEITPFTMTDFEGQPLEGQNGYVIHFDADQFPPVHAFWSITLYNPEGFLVSNTSERYAVRSTDGLTFNSDGSLDIYIQSDSPGGDREANWLPAPAEGQFTLIMRLYQPKRQIRDGTWQIPAVRVASQGEAS